MDGRSCIISVSAAGTLYASVPLGGGRFRTRRCRKPAPGCAAEPEKELIGVVLSVTLDDDPQAVDTAGLVRCWGRQFRTVPGSSGRPLRGYFMAVGGTPESIQEVSSPIRETHPLELDRAWAIDLAMRAYRNHDRAWRQILQEQRYEDGDEGLSDDALDALGRDARDACYRRRLVMKARERDRRASRFGMTLRPMVIPVSNEELEERLDEVAGGSLVAAAIPTMEAVA